MALTVRMSPETERALSRLTKRRKLSRSDVVREAIARYEEAQNEAPAEGPYDAWADVLGIVNLGVRDTGRTTGDQFADLVRADTRRAR
ncbi:MAG TPA: CopG family transcriptional regulator [Vicinamibacterales bacterium]|nr:CopG family transcriptional regulator [Vicinamibacterales bacterium]